MNFKKITILLLVLLVADQALKIWIKTHMTLDEAIMVVPTWFQLRFIENNGAAFGMHTLNSELCRLVNQGTITPQAAYQFSNDRKDLEQYL